jgi:hypothetical protein
MLNEVLSNKLRERLVESIADSVGDMGRYEIAMDGIQGANDYSDEEMIDYLSVWEDDAELMELLAQARIELEIDAKLSE